MLLSTVMGLLGSVKPQLTYHPLFAELCLSSSFVSDVLVIQLPTLRSLSLYCETVNCHFKTKILTIISLVCLP